MKTSSEQHYKIHSQKAILPSLAGSDGILPGTGYVILPVVFT
jgi:hypothetical protein